LTTVYAMIDDACVGVIFWNTLLVLLPWLLF